MRGYTLVEILIIIVFVIILGTMAASGAARMSCKNGENVPTGSGAMDCWGNESFKHCEPETKFVCHDR